LECAFGVVGKINSTGHNSKNDITQIEFSSPIKEKCISIVAFTLTSFAFLPLLPSIFNDSITTS
jgi:hypothetical protein